MKNYHAMRFFLLVLLVFSSRSYGLEPIQQQLQTNRVDMGTTLVSPDKSWTLSMRREKKDGPYSLVISHGSFDKTLTESSKPDNRIYWSEDGKYVFVIKPVGFVTMADIFALDAAHNAVKEIFSSEKHNTRYFVDYSLKRVDLKAGFAVFDVTENDRYLEGRQPRLFATEYIYLDGDNGFTANANE